MAFFYFNLLVEQNLASNNFPINSNFIHLNTRSIIQPSMGRPRTRVMIHARTKVSLKIFSTCRLLPVHFACIKGDVSDGRPADSQRREQQQSLAERLMLLHSSGKLGMKTKAFSRCSQPASTLWKGRSFSVPFVVLDAVLGSLTILLFHPP